MATAVEKPHHTPPPPHKHFFLTQIALRVSAAAATLAASSIMLSSTQSTLVFGIPVVARYSYSPAFKFFVYANLIVCAFTILSLFITFFLGNKPVDPTYYFYVFLHDLMNTLLLMAGCSAATAVGYVGKYGNSHAGWQAICGYFAKFCNKGTAASSLSYLAILFYLMLTVISANKSRHIHI